MFCGSEKLIRFLGDFPRRLAIRFIFLFLFFFFNFIFQFGFEFVLIFKKSNGILVSGEGI